MKKLLLSCFLALGLGLNAQISYLSDFETTTDIDQYAQFGGGTFQATAACNGEFGGQIALSAAQPSSGWMVLLDVLVEELGKPNNFQSTEVTLNYKKAATSSTATLNIALFTYNAAANNWSIEYIGSSTSLSAAAINTCASKTATIPAGKMQPGVSYGIGVWISGAAGNYFVDDINIVQESVAQPPACTSFTNVTDGGVIAAGTATFTWSAVATAVNYNVAIGTTPGGNNVFSGAVAGTSLNVFLNPNTTYYASITPANTAGTASGCTPITFSTNNVVGYCGVTTTAPNALAPIKSVSFANSTYTSDPSAVTIGAHTLYQDFSNQIFEVRDDVTTLPITIQGVTNGNPANGWAYSVFIDWNSDGDFTDANESYFNTTATMIRVGGVADNPVTLTGNITVPAGAIFGQKRMRIKYNFSGTTINPALATACAVMTNGQVEDYTINYQAALAVGDVQASKLSVYPNPFVDVLNITDIRGVKSIIVTDAVGRVAQTFAPAKQIDLSSLRSGMYLITLKYEDGSTKTLKSIKK